MTEFELKATLTPTTERRYNPQRDATIEEVAKSLDLSIDKLYMWIQQSKIDYTYNQAGEIYLTMFQTYVLRHRYRHMGAELY